MLLDRDQSLIDNSRGCISNRCTLFFFVYCPEYYSGIPYQLRTIHALFTHNRRTIHALFLILPQRMKIQSPPLHSTPYTRKIALKCDFSCTSANFVVPLHREPTLGMSALGLYSSVCELADTILHHSTQRYTILNNATGEG